MLRSALFAPIQREGKKDEASHSAYYFNKMGYTSAIGAGLYTHLPLGHILFNNVKNILNEELEKHAECSFHEFPGVAPEALWQESGRLELFGNSIFRYRDQHGKKMILAPTHEVTAAKTAAQHIRSYKELPVRISQIQNKFRDETRPRAGVIRSRQFQMHDLYSFDINKESAELGYQKVKRAYEETFRRLCIPALPVAQTDMGAIGGDGSHEFHCPAEIGDDTVVDYAGETKPSLELAHIFMLGTDYSEALNAYYVDRNNKKIPIYMCSFGMGIERTAAAYIECNIKRNHKAQELIWSWNLSPFQIMILGDTPFCFEMYLNQKAKGRRCLLDDRDLGFGQKLAQGFQLGFPIYLVQGPKDSAQSIQLVCRPLGIDMTISTSDIKETVEVVIDQLRAHEAVACYGTPIAIEPSQQVIFGQFKSLASMNVAIGARHDISPSKMGNFGEPKPAQQVRGKCGKYWLNPIVASDISKPEMMLQDDLKYLAWPKKQTPSLKQMKGFW